MNIQIFGKSKCFDTKKAERWFKERRVKYQSIDLIKYGMSGKEFDSVLRAVGGIDKLIDWDSKSQEITNMKYMDDTLAKEPTSVPPQPQNNDATFNLPTIITPHIVLRYLR